MRYLPTIRIDVWWNLGLVWSMQKQMPHRRHEVETNFLRKLRFRTTDDNLLGVILNAACSLLLASFCISRCITFPTHYAIFRESEYNHRIPKAILSMPCCRPSSRRGLVTWHVTNEVGKRRLAIHRNVHVAVRNRDHTPMFLIRERNSWLSSTRLETPIGTERELEIAQLWPIKFWPCPNRDRYISYLKGPWSRHFTTHSPEGPWIFG